MLEARWMFWKARRSCRKAILRWRTNLSAWRWFWRSYSDYRKLLGSGGGALCSNLQPYLGDNTGVQQMDPTYFYQDCWAFERIIKRNPASHVDVGSHHKYVGLLSKVIPVIMVDVRPLSLAMDSLKFLQASILNLPFKDGSVASLSSLCVIEHIGLGRYGDILDPQGSEKAIKELKRVISPGGDLYISVPIDDLNTTFFNAHRAFTEDYLKALFAPFTILDCQYIYGGCFCSRRQKGFGTGCYHLRCPEAEPVEGPL